MCPDVPGCTAAVRFGKTNPRRWGEAPSIKHQMTDKSQNSNPNEQNGRHRRFEIRISCFESVWSLMLDASSFRHAVVPVVQHEQCPQRLGAVALARAVLGEPA